MNDRRERYETWREQRLRERHNRLRKTVNRDNGCLCDTGPVIVATWRGPFSTLTVGRPGTPRLLPNPIHPLRPRHLRGRRAARTPATGGGEVT